MAETTNPTTALARLQQSASSSITTAADLAKRIGEWKEAAHVLTPAISISSIAPQHAINVAVVVIDPKVGDNGQGDDTYGLDSKGKGLPWLRPGERAINRVGLLKLAQAAGVSWDAAASGRTDDRKERFYWEYKAVGHYVGFDGGVQTLVGTFELDLRNGSPALKGFSDSQVEQARKNGMRLCESKAQAAAIRELGLKQKYTVAELAKPFVILRTSFVPDMKDPMQRRMVAERGLAGAGALYPAARQIGAGRADDIVIDAERVETVDTPSGKVDTGTGEIVGDTKPSNGNAAAGAAPSDAPKVASDAPKAPADAPKPAEPTGPTITKVEVQTGKTKDAVDAQGNVTCKGGRDFTRYFVTLSDGVLAFTFNTDIGTLAEQFRDANVPVEVDTEPGKKGGNRIVQLRRAQPSLPLDEDGPTDADVAGQY